MQLSTLQKNATTEDVLLSQVDTGVIYYLKVRANPLKYIIMFLKIWPRFFTYFFYNPISRATTCP